MLEVYAWFEAKHSIGFVAKHGILRGRGGGGPPGGKAPSNIPGVFLLFEPTSAFGIFSNYDIFIGRGGVSRCS